MAEKSETISLSLSTTDCFELVRMLGNETGFQENESDNDVIVWDAQNFTLETWVKPASDHETEVEIVAYSTALFDGGILEQCVGTFAEQLENRAKLFQSKSKLDEAGKDNNQIFCPSCGAVCIGGASYCSKCGASLPQINPSASPLKKSDFVTLACPNCGGNLKITQDMERFVCQYCGLEHIVRRESGIVSLAPVVEGLKRVENKFDQILSGSDRMAAEQTIQRLKSEISQLEKQIAQKQKYLNKRMNIVVYLFFIIVGVILFLGWLRAPDTLSGLLFSMVFGIVGGIGAIVSLGNIHKFKKAQEELLKFEKNLQSRKQELDNLHRYTVER